MNQEMTFGQAVDWIGADSSRVVKLVNGETLLRFNVTSNQFEVSCGTGTWEADKNIRLNFAIKWRPYVPPKPKSVIEEAIEREVADALTYKLSDVGNGLDLSDRISLAMRRIANATLDEAKKAAVGKKEICYRLNDQIENDIDALKVTV